VEVGKKAVLLGTLGVHVYVKAPPPFKITELPEQMIVLLALAVTGGIGWMETEMTAVELPQALKPVTTYVAETVGEKATPLVMPPVHV
jgi:hypothetical protein